MKRSEALDIIRKNWPDGRVQLQEALLTLAPELKESEDEKIRKGLIEHLKELKEQSVEGSHLKRPEHYDAWIAWLEEQGQHKPVISDEAIREGVAHFGITQYQISNWLKKYIDIEKQGSQNLANSAKTCKDEQNSSWSEEDERMINSIIKNLDEGEWFDIYQANWLKSLKERVQPQNK